MRSSHTTIKREIPTHCNKKKPMHSNEDSEQPPKKCVTYGPGISLLDIYAREMECVHKILYTNV